MWAARQQSYVISNYSNLEDSSLTIPQRITTYNRKYYLCLLLPLSLTAYKETAYVHALSLAAIAYTVAKGCRQGVLQSCSCDSNDDLELPTAAGPTYRPGCSDNVDFGLTFAENFLIMRYGPVGLKEEMDIHNFRAGRRVSFCKTALYVA